jgi:Zn-finger nucleic acid-binding protein
MFGSRYICDECGGMLIDFDDFAQALADLAGEDPNPRYDYRARVAKACPRCERAFVEVAIVLELESKKLALGAVFLRCERDGLWLAGGQLEGVLEKVSRVRSGIIRQYGGEGSDPAIGPDGLPETRFGLPARHRGPAVARAPAVDPYKNQTLACPSCLDQPLGFQADRWTCAVCTGTFVQADAVVAMMMDIRGSYWELPPIAVKTGSRQCPVCRTALAVGELEGVTVDRCAEHGIWFDAGELAASLKGTTEGKRSWFAKLFKSV